jgi:serine/threonine-protein kinase HipA
MSGDATLGLQLQVGSGRWVDVGHLHHVNNRNWFEFHDTYWDMADRPVLGQIFEERGRAWRPSAMVALPHWFSHLLPEGRLRSAVAAAAHSHERREFELLKLLGVDDLPGAIRVLPVDVHGGRLVPDDSYDEGDEVARDDPLLKFSLAGAQLKFSVYGKGKGLTVPAAGQAGNVILKFPDERPNFSGVPEAELACLVLAREAGIDTLNATLVSPHDVAGLEDWARRSSGMALAVTRFDRREDDVRIHMEELAQVMDIPTAVERAKYARANIETIGVLVAALCGADAVMEVIDRVVLNVLVGNGDAHLKNWAVRYENGRTPTLSPLYDVLPTVLYIAEDDLGLYLNKSRSFTDVVPESFDRLASRAGLDVRQVRQRVRDTAERISERWPVLADYLGAEAYRRLSARRETLPLLR